MCLIPSSSPSTHGCHSGEPYDMHPKMIRETFRPDLPKRTSRADQHISEVCACMGLTVGHIALLAVVRSHGGGMRDLEVG
jgi:hypothetical protein